MLPPFYYGFYSAFSGQTIYEAYIYQCYNIVFTAFPIIWFALFDKEVREERLLQEPKEFYVIGLKSQCFGRAIFWKWIVYAIL